MSKGIDSVVCVQYGQDRTGCMWVQVGMSASRVVHVLHLRLHHLLPRNLAPIVGTLKIGRANKHVFCEIQDEF
jgi:hypothetical protein